MQPQPNILHIALPVPLRPAFFEYIAPENAPEPIAQQQQSALGTRVEVNFAGRALIGVLVGFARKSQLPPEKIKRCDRVIDQEPIVPHELIDLSFWVSTYYGHPFGETLFTFLPTAIREGKSPKSLLTACWKHTHEGLGLPDTALKRSPKQQTLHQLLLTHTLVTQSDLAAHNISPATAKTMEARGLIVREDLPVSELGQAKTHPDQLLLKEAPPSLSVEQTTCLDALRYHTFGCYLLEGIAGSGKTEVYLQAIARVLNSGKQALVLIPEIGLTPQTLQRFRRRFTSKVVELHSNVAAGARAENWVSAAIGEADIVIGTRLAAATPMKNLGVIVVDEEHDTSFKQNDGLRYSARDLAIVRAQRLRIPLILGSATPSLESLNNALTQKYTHLRLTHRPIGVSLPVVSLVDLRKETQIQAGISDAALTQIQATLDQQGQVLVFINRRGYAPSILCRVCGWCASCQACSAKLTLHAYPKQLRCHHCDRRHSLPKQCPDCRSPHIAPIGAGTERCEETLKQLFPKTDVLRVDTDSMSSKTAMAELAQRLSDNDPCVLVGTQMLAKGHHFPNLRLVVMLDVDTGLFSGDFRGTERLGQQIVQVAGRAGRGEGESQVLIQTYKPEHPLFSLLLNEGYSAFAQHLLSEREHAQMPPFFHLAVIKAESKRAENASEFIQQALQCAKNLLPPSPTTHYLGPIPGLIEKKQDRWRFQGQLNTQYRKVRQNLLPEWLAQIDALALSKRVRWSIDVDPLDLS